MHYLISQFLDPGGSHFPQPIPIISHPPTRSLSLSTLTSLSVSLNNALARLFLFLFARSRFLKLIGVSSKLLEYHSIGIPIPKGSTERDGWTDGRTDGRLGIFYLPKALSK